MPVPCGDCLTVGSWKRGTPWVRMHWAYLTCWASAWLTNAELVGLFDPQPATSAATPTQTITRFMLSPRDMHCAPCTPRPVSSAYRYRAETGALYAEPTMRVLVIEDDEELAQTIASRARASSRMAVDVALDGRAGLARALINDYDVIGPTATYRNCTATTSANA